MHATASRDARPILVTGATGKTGRRVAARLERAGHAVRRASRRSTTPFDWSAPSSWEAALAGVRAAYVAYVPDLAVPGAGSVMSAFAAAARGAGVECLVLLSGRGEPAAEACERAVAQAGVPTTVLRCSWFAQNFSEGLLYDALAAGELALPVGAVGEPFVDLEDVADVAVAALTDARHAGQLYELTGPRLWTFAEAVAAIASAAGRPLRFRQIGLDDFLHGARAQGIPAQEVELLAYLFAEVLDGRNASTTDGVRRALAREPRDFVEYARAAAASGAWASAARSTAAGA